MNIVCYMPILGGLYYHNIALVQANGISNYVGFESKLNEYWPSNNSDHISTEGGHAEHVLVTRISNKMDTSSTDKQIFECSICPSPVEFRSAIYIASASG